MPEEKKEAKKKKTTTTTKKKTTTSKSTTKKKKTTTTKKKPEVKKVVEEKVVVDEVIETTPVKEEVNEELLDEVVETPPVEEEVPVEEVKEETIDEVVETTPIEEVEDTHIEEEVPVEEIKEETVDELVETPPADSKVSVKDFEDEAIEAVEVTAQAVADTVNEPVREMVSGDLHKKPSIIIYLLVLFCIAFMVLVGIFAYYQGRIDKKQGSFKLIDEYHYRVLNNDYYLVSSEEDLNSIFPKKSIRGTNFDKYNYVVLEIPFDPCAESHVKPVGYERVYNTLNVKVEYKAHCGGCAPSYLYYLLELDKDVQFNNVKYDSKATNNPHCNPNVAYKPLIYLYPEKETKVNVRLGNPDLLTSTYPEYNDGWNVVAYPNGTLKDKNREYYSLFWEGKNHEATIHDEGFVVKGEDTLKFLENKLKVLGLNDKEANEFIIYWLPKLEVNPYNYYYFETMKEINNYMPLEVTPKPDTIIRVQMDYQPLNEKIDVKEQKLFAPKRSGFTVVEWGGSIIKD